MTHVLIVTPTAGGSVKSLFAATLANAIIAIKDAGWGVEWLSLDGAYIARARNLFAHRFLSDPRYTHLLMIDSDMSVQGSTICRMIRSTHPVVAAAYSQRRIDLDAFARAAQRSDLTLADRSSLAMNYNIWPAIEPGTRHIEVTDGMCRVRQVALGCATIRRDALERLIAAEAVRLRPDDWLQKLGFEGPFYGFFDEIVLENGDVLSEDYSFCHRWLSMPENKIWAIIDEPIGHVGDMVFSAPYLNRLRQGKAVSAF